MISKVDKEKFGLKPHQIQMIQKVFVDFPEISEVWLYGSRARGDFQRASDIDFCLFDEIGFSIYLDILNKLDDLYIPFKFDLTRFKKLDNQNLKNNILKEKKLFYKKPASA